MQTHAIAGIGHGSRFGGCCGKSRRVVDRGASGRLAGCARGTILVNASERTL